MKLGRLSEVTQISTVRRVQGRFTVLCAVRIFLWRKIECLMCGANLSLGGTPKNYRCKDIGRSIGTRDTVFCAVGTHLFWETKI